VGFIDGKTEMSPATVTTGKTIIRAVSIISCISGGINSVTGIGETCSLNKATVHRLLKVLEKTNLVREDPVSRLYMLGSLFTQFVSAPLVPHEYLIRCADREMKRLARDTQESVHLDILSGTYDMILKSIASTRVLRIVEETRESDYLHAGATGKVLLSQLNDKDLRVALKYTHFKHFTDKTVIQADELMAQIKQIRQEGHAISIGERISGVIAISVPVKKYVVPAAISILGPQDRLNPEIDHILKEMKQSCAIISKEIQELSDFNEVDFEPDCQTENE
jgi:IclR family transcriptional regulator, KDG regulon repressor